MLETHRTVARGRLLKLICFRLLLGEDISNLIGASKQTEVLRGGRGGGWLSAAMEDSCGISAA